MDVRLKAGLYAGEIRDIPAPEAKIMLADGRAEDPRLDSLDMDEEDPKPKAKPKKR